MASRPLLVLSRATHRRRHSRPPKTPAALMRSALAPRIVLRAAAVTPGGPGLIGALTRAIEFGRALPSCIALEIDPATPAHRAIACCFMALCAPTPQSWTLFRSLDRKSTRLNSSHG